MLLIASSGPEPLWPDSVGGGGSSASITPSGIASRDFGTTPLRFMNHLQASVSSFSI